MAQVEEEELTPEQLDAKFAKMKAAMQTAQLERGAATRKAKERNQQKKLNSRLLRHTGRDKLFTFRVREDLVDRAKTVAKERKEKIAAWMEAAIEAAIERHERERQGDAS
jgi:hypothetical protein